jgi:hypothetical protein
MINLILASNLNAVEIAMLCIMGLCITAIIVTFILEIYKVFNENKRYKNACENQRLMFNQLKKGDYVWEVSGEELKNYVVIYAGYCFDRNNICKEVRISLRSLTDEWNTRNINIPVDDSQTFKCHDYYTIYNEASLLQRGIKLKRDKQRNAAKEVTNEKLVEETTKLIERLNKIKQDYL